MSAQASFTRLAADDGRGALVTVVAGEPLGAKLLVGADGSREGTLGSDAADAAALAAAEELMSAIRVRSSPPPSAFRMPTR